MQKEIIYTRTSTEQKVDTSGHQQMTQLVTYCRRNNLMVIKHYHDNASGKDFHRPALSSF